MRKYNKKRKNTEIIGYVLLLILAIILLMYSEGQKQGNAEEPLVATPNPTIETISTPVITPDPIPNSEDVELLAHLIYAEAGGEGKECMAAVGAVVLNRVKHPGYPDSIRGVIFQKGQYSCTWNGAFEKEPSEDAIYVARALLENELREVPVKVLPPNVIYQALFEQGDGTYRKIGSEYFCYEGQYDWNEGYML